MKKTGVFIVLLLILCKVNSQSYAAHKWYAGPSIGIGFLSRNYKIMKDNDQYSAIYKAGGYVGYSITDLFGIQMEGYFNGTLGGESTKSILIPGMFMFHFNSEKYVGLGVQYNYTLTNSKKEDILFFDINDRYYSLFLEFSTLTKQARKKGIVTLFTNQLFKWRLNFRIGYAMMPGYLYLKQFDQLDEKIKKISYHPFFFETSTSIDIIDMVKNNKSKKTLNEGKRKLRNSSK